MIDECKNCVCRGNIKVCKMVLCSQHESWYAVEQQKQIDFLNKNFEIDVEVNTKDED